MKTSHTVFRSGVTIYDSEPTFSNNLIEYNEKYYVIGEEHKEFHSEKIWDEDYYILTLDINVEEGYEEQIYYTLSEMVNPNNARDCI